MEPHPTYQQTSHAIEVLVQPIYLDEHSDPGEHQYIWAYNIEIRNSGQETVQLISRYWRITNAFGQVEEVRGQGVVGEQPVLEPGDAFSYTSSAPLTTPSGMMVGTYQMRTQKGDWLEVSVPAFSLDSPHETPKIN